MLPDSWLVLGRTVLIGVLAYIGLVATLRVSGKRTLSKWNAFDLVVTVAFGSSLATVVLSKTVSLIEGLLLFVLLAGLQFVITWSSVRWRWVRRVTHASPRLLVYQGKVLDESLIAERISREELFAELRGHGFTTPADAYAVVLETDGSVSVMSKPGSRNDALAPVNGYAQVAG